MTPTQTTLINTFLLGMFSFACYKLYCEWCRLFVSKETYQELLTHLNSKLQELRGDIEVLKKENERSSFFIERYKLHLTDDVQEAVREYITDDRIKKVLIRRNVQEVAKEVLQEELNREFEMTLDTVKGNFKFLYPDGSAVL